MFYFVLGNVYLTFKKADGICGFWKFWNLEMFYPPKGRLLADSKGVHLFLLMFYFVLGNVYLTFKKGRWNMRILKILKSWNVLSPEGTSARRLQRGPFVFTYVLFCVRKRIFDIQKRSMEYADFENFEILKCFIYGWMDGWMDGWGIKSVLKKSSYFVCI